MAQTQFLPLGLMAAMLLAHLSTVAWAQDHSQLSLDYYKSTCPNAEKTVRTEMECAVREDPRNAAAMLRLHFHDCFVQVSSLHQFSKPGKCVGIIFS